MTIEVAAGQVAAGQIEAAAKATGLAILSIEAAESEAGTPTTRYTLALHADHARTHRLDLSQQLAENPAALHPSLQPYLADVARRLRNPRPDCYVTLHGLPLSFAHFAWPFHPSTSGADTSVVHGEVRLEDGGDAHLHAKVAASMTVTFQEIVGLPEQPFAESYIYNAVRKIFDQGQLELVKSGNRQPVPVTMRYYSARQQKFIFNDTTPEQRKSFLAAKAYWLSGVLGAGQPVWMLDPRDAQYLDTTLDELRRCAAALHSQGLLSRIEDEFAAAAPQLMEQGESFRTEMASALAFLKPTFNEQMRSGLTNM